MSKGGPDSDWIKARVSESGLGSLRGLARAMGMDIAPLSRAVSGERKFTLEEVREISDLLGVPMGEMIRRLGVAFRKSDGV